MTSPSSLAAVGISKESAFGVGVAPVLLLPVVAPVLADDVGWQRDGSWRVAPTASFNHVVSSLASKVNVGGPLLPDGIGFPLAAVLGDVQFAAGTPNLWTFALLNSGTQQPPSYQLVANDPTGQVSYNGVTFSSVDVSFSGADALLTWSAQAAGLAGAASAWTMPAPSSERPVAVWRAQASIAGAVEGRLLAADVTLARAVTAKYNVDNALVPYMYLSDVLTVSGTLTIVAATDTYRQAVLAGTSYVLSLAFDYGTGAARRSLGLRMSDVTFTDVARDYGSSWVELNVAFEADANVTDVGASGGWSPILATLRNAAASGTYA